MRSRGKRLATAIAAVAFAAAGLTAADPAPAGAAAEGSAVSASGEGFDAAALRAFAKASGQVGALRAEYVPRIRIANSVESTARAEDLFAEMRARMHAAIEAAGLTPDTYSALAGAVERDPALRRRIDGMHVGASTQRDGGASPSGPPAAPPTADARRVRRELDAAHAMLIDLRSQLEAERARTLEVRTRQAEMHAEQAAETARRAEASARGEAARVRAEAGRAALRREIEWLAGELSATGEAMATLAATLDPAKPGAGEAASRAGAVSGSGFRPLQPASMFRYESARRVAPPGLTEPGPSREALLREIEAERTRAAGAQARHAADRTAARREIVRLARELARSREALTGLAASLDAASPEAEVLGAPPDDTPIAAMPAGGRRADRMPAEEPPAEDVPADEPLAEVVPAKMSEISALPVLLDAAELAAAPAVFDPPDGAPAPDPGAGGPRPGVVHGIAAYMEGDYRRAYAIWEPLADAGMGRAQFHLGALYYEGRGIARDLPTARRWLERSLDSGYAPAGGMLARVRESMASRTD